MSLSTSNLRRRYDGALLDEQVAELLSVVVENDDTMIRGSRENIYKRSVGRKHVVLSTTCRLLLSGRRVHVYARNELRSLKDDESVIIRSRTT